MSKNKKYNNSTSFEKFFKNNKVGIYFFAIIFLLIALTIYNNPNSKSENTNLINKTYGDDVIEMYYFHLTTCPHCIEQNKFMDKVLFKKYPNLRIHRFEMTQKDSYLKYQEMSKKFPELDIKNFPGTPLTIIGDRTNIGFGTELTTGPKIISMVEDEQKRINLNWNSSKKRTIDLN